MKKLLLLSLTLLLISPISGQDLTKWEVGIDAGLNLSKMTGQWEASSRDITISESSKSKFMCSPAFGIFTAYNFTPVIALTTGLYMMKSGVMYINKDEFEGETYESRQKQRYTTLRLPVMVRFMWGTKWQYYGLLGFYISKRLCGKYVYEDWQGDKQSRKVKFKKDPENSGDDDVIYLNTENVTRINIGVQGGIGIRRMIGPGLLSFNTTFGYGFCDFNKWESKDDRPDGYKAFHDMNIVFFFGYAIALGSSL